MYFRPEAIPGIPGMQKGPDACVGAFFMEGMTGIEPAYQAWEACALPLSYSRIFFSVSRLLATREMCRGCLGAGRRVEMVGVEM